MALSAFRCPKCDGIEAGQEGEEGQSSSEELEILRLLYQVDESVEPERFADQLGTDVGRAKYWLKKLEGRKHVHMHLFMGAAAKYSITDQGRAYLIENEYV